MREVTVHNDQASKLEDVISVRPHWEGSGSGAVEHGDEFFQEHP